MYKVISSIMIILILTSCSTTSKNLSVSEILPREGYVFIKKIVNLRKCESGICVDGRISSAGSGFIVKTTYRGSFVMTASHVCVTNRDHLQPGVTATDVLQVETLGGKFYDASVLAHNPDIDACLMFAENLVDDVETIPMASEAPVPGDKVYNIASPYGIHYPNVVPIFEGRYIGERGHKGFYTFDAGPGSSGSMILNEDGELIGLLHSVYRDMHQIVVSVDYNSLRQFIQRGLVEHSANHHREILNYNKYHSNTIGERF
jgi:S1-C subfamily serine protease